MKILFLTNNDVSRPLIQWLSITEEVLVLAEKIDVTHIQSINPDLIISYSYRHLIKQETLTVKPNKVINLHISLLPYNRGADPNIWSFLENTPKGVTIHVVDEGIDTGPILFQQELVIDESLHTLASSYLLLHTEIQNLFKKNWNKIKSGHVKPSIQSTRSTYHYSKEFIQIKDHLLGVEGWEIPIKLLKDRFSKIKNNLTSN